MIEKNNLVITGCHYGFNKNKSEHTKHFINYQSRQDRIWKSSNPKISI